MGVNAGRGGDHACCSCGCCGAASAGRWRSALGVPLALAPLLKGTGYAMFPPTRVALALVRRGATAQHWRTRARRHRRCRRGRVLVVTLGWGELSAEVGRADVHARRAAARRCEGMPALRAAGRGDRLRLAGLPPADCPACTSTGSQSWPAFDIYGVRGWGAFGWYAVTWAARRLLGDHGALLALTALGPGRRRAPRRVGARDAGPSCSCSSPSSATVIGVMTLAYYTPTPQGDLYPHPGPLRLPGDRSRWRRCSSGRRRTASAAVRSPSGCRPRSCASATPRCGSC